jgi:hypothetical protein
VSAKKNRRHSRRDFLLVSLGAASAGLATLHASPALAQDLPHLSTDEPLAKALGYVNEASQVDRSKFPTYKPGEACDKCRFYQGKAGQAWGPCQIYAGKSVNAHGWCASFMVKT